MITPKTGALQHGSLFSGIGGFDLAAEWMGWKNKFHCEWNEFGQEILNYYWPEAKSYGDITTTDFTIWNGKIDILTGGFPCQPYSQAGKRRGKEDERHLWPEMLRAIKEIEPRWIVGENVYGIINWNDGVVFEEVQTDLEDEGYKVQPYILPAVSVNAPHRRDRVWFIAYSASDRRGRDRKRAEIKKRLQSRPISSGELAGGFKGSCLCGDAPHTTEPRLERREKSRQRQEHSRLERPCGKRHAPNPSKQGLQGSEIKRSIGRSGEESHKQLAGRFRTKWQKFPTQSPVCNGDDGFPSELDGITFAKWRSESIKGGGNAIVPQVALQIFKAIEAYENS